MTIFRRLLSLAGLAGLALALPQAAQALSYSLIDAELPGCKGECPKIIYATGTIGPQEHLRLAEFIRDSMHRHRVSSLVVINSGGGYNGGAFMLGILMRRAKMTVVVGRPVGGTVTRSTGMTSGTCASACVLVLAGGAKRFTIPGSRVGVHRASPGVDIPDAATGGRIVSTVNHDDVKSAYGRYFQTMGVSAQLATIMDKTPAESMYWLNNSEMSKLKLASSFSSNGR